MRDSYFNVYIISSKGSLGIWNYSEGLLAGFIRIGVQATLIDKEVPPPHSNGVIHFQFGNSTRSLIPLMKKCMGYAITMHDVIPRNKFLRPFLSLFQHKLIAKRAKFCIVHSQYAKAQLELRGYNHEVKVIRHAAHKPILMRGKRHFLDKDNKKLVLCFAGQIRKEKGFWNIISVVDSYPEIIFIFLGSTIDKRIGSALSKRRSNVIWVPDADNETFNNVIAASDFLLNFRKESVGETSGPVVRALALGTSVAGYDVGFMKEYIVNDGILFNKSESFERCIPRIIEFWESKVNNFSAKMPSSAIPSWEEVAREHIEAYKQFYSVGSE